MDEVYVSLLNIVSQEVVPHFYMFGSGLKHGFLATLMALVLSHMRGTWEHSSPKSLSVYVIQSSCEQQLAATTYSASVVDWATLDCLREDQEASENPETVKYPESISDRLDISQSRHPKN
jgi:hypothetical protein